MDKGSDEFGRLLGAGDEIKEIILSGCGRMIGPYPCCSVVEGDCRDLLCHLSGVPIDALITDPPYGGGLAVDFADRFKTKAGKWWNVSDRSGQHRHTPILGDDRPYDPQPILEVKAKYKIFWGANWYAARLPDSGGWLVWDKRNGKRDVSDADWPMSEGELAWSNIGKGVRIFRHTWFGLIRDSERDAFHHPTQKPIELMMWCVEQAKFPETILDPYCGSGTTLVAAKKLGKHFLGMELDPQYVAIARKRLAEIDAQPSLFEPKPEQMTLTDTE
jgi:site-specific DNA-methyltransferase (adenine-specific)/modification methylase